MKPGKQKCPVLNNVWGQHEKRALWQLSVCVFLTNEKDQIKVGTQQESRCAVEGLKYRREYSWRSRCEMTKPGGGNGEDRCLASHRSRLTSTNRYTTCGDSIRKPLATDRLWANSCLGGVHKWEGSVYKDKITQWIPSTCATSDKDRTVSYMAAGGRTLLELNVYVQANKITNARLHF